MVIVVVSGGFDPLHSGHIAYMRAAKEMGDILLVALNSDDWLVNKKGKYFMNFHERKTIVENLSFVDKVIDFNDDDFGSCKNALIKIKKLYPDHKIIFCNGGDRNENNIPEMDISDIDFAFNVGGSKKLNSSSSLLKENSYSFESRIWGKFYNLFHGHKIKVKELIIEPGKGMSFQRHHKRNELWFISKGNCIVNISKNDVNNFDTISLYENDNYVVEKKTWHQLINKSSKACHIIEIQYGEITEESDIERIRFYEGNELND